MPWILVEQASVDSISDLPVFGAYGVFTLSDSDSYAVSETNCYGIGCYCFLKKSVQWTYANSYSNTDGYCTQFDTNISTSKVF